MSSNVVAEAVNARSCQVRNAASKLRKMMSAISVMSVVRWMNRPVMTELATFQYLTDEGCAALQGRRAGVGQVVALRGGADDDEFAGKIIPQPVRLAGQPP